MKALVLERPLTLAYREVPEPRVAADEVLVRVRACGICGSDVHGLDGSTGRRIPPLVMGHEAAGTVEEVGAAVAGWERGSRVTFDSTIFCGACWYCRRGAINLCDNRRVLGVSCAEYKRDGAFAELVAVPARVLYRLPDAVTFERAAMVEALSVAVHAVGRAAVCQGDTAVVVGAGMIGCLVVQALRRSGCARIVAVELDAERRARALSLGADLALADAAEAEARVKELTEGRGADVAFEVVGLTPTLAGALACVRKGGTLVLVGNLSPRVEMALQYAVTREVTLRGSCASCWDYPTCLDLIRDGRVNVDALVSAVAPLADGASWFQRLFAGERGLMKVILTP
jgi:L-iditol 2-dehydrogenase